MDDDRQARGAALMRELYPGDAGARTAEMVSRFSPDLGALFVQQVFGEIYSRPGLDLRQRQMVTLGCLTAMGDSDRQLRIQVTNSLNVGVTEAEIAEAILHAAIFAGWGRAINAMAIAREIFDARRGADPNATAGREDVT